MSSSISDFKIISTIKELLPGHFVYCKSQWYSWSGRRWEASDRFLRLAISEKVFEGAAVPPGTVARCVLMGQRYLRDDTLAFDTRQWMFGCDNGVLNLRTGLFRPHQLGDYMTWSCGYDFCKLPVPDAALVVDAVMAKYFPDPDIRSFVLDVLATALSGEALKHVFVFNLENSASPLLIKLMRDVLGDYFGCVSQSCITDTLPVGIHKKRYVVVDGVVSSSGIIDNNTVRKMSSGDSIITGEMRSQLCMTLVIQCQGVPRFKSPLDDCLLSRIVDIPVCSVGDGDIPVSQELRNAMLNVLLTRQHTDCIVPQVVCDRINMYTN